MRLLVDSSRQTLTLFRGEEALRTWCISTARAGLNAREGSGGTPPGLHAIARLYGHQSPLGQVFVSRRAVKGHILAPELWHGPDTHDYILTRILRLKGLEPGLNCGPGIDSYARYIYIHGTNQEHLLGTPASHGCIRMANLEVVELFRIVQRHRSLHVFIQ